MQPNYTANNDNSSDSANLSNSFSTIFGNFGFQVMPATPGKIDTGFPSIPYVSLEALLANAATTNPAINPSNVLSGSSVGEQATTGQNTSRDSTGTTRVSDGFSHSI